MDINMLLKLMGVENGGAGAEDHGNVIIVKSMEHLDEELEKAGDKLVAMDAYAEWCMPCKIIGPTFIELSKKYTNTVFLKFDVDQLRDIAAKYRIRAMPTFVFLRAGKKIDSFSGADPTKLEENIAKHGGEMDSDWESIQAEEKKKKAGSHGNVIIIESMEHLEEEFEKAGDKLVAMDAYAEWCMPCKIIGPTFIELSKKYTDVVFLKFDVDQLRDIAAKFKIRAMPTFVFVRNGRKIDSFSGADPTKLEDTIVRLMN